MSRPHLARVVIGRSLNCGLSISRKLYRLNLWAAKPYFPGVHVPGSGMENSTYMPNPLTSPALMVLASTAEASRESGPRVSVPSHHPSYPSQVGVDKESAMTTFNHTFPMYRQGDHFPSPLYAPLPPYIRPNMEHGVPMLSAPASSNVSAFRPVTSSVMTSPSEVAEKYHSAFLPTKRSKLESGLTCTSGALNLSTYSSAERHSDTFDYSECRNDGETVSCQSPHELSKDEQASSVSSNNGDTNSETHSEVGDYYDNSVQDDSRHLRKPRKRCLTDGQTCCPACGVTLRPGEIEAHYAMEIEKLEKITRNGRRSSSRDSILQGRKASPLSPTGNRRGRESPLLGTIANSRYETYQRIKANRQTRLSVRSRTRRKKSDEPSCPICNEKLCGTPEELNAHVNECLKSRGECDEDGPVDIEGDTDQYEEYEWAGQTRVRATTMLHGGFAASGFQTSNTHKSGDAADEDVDLNVDGDDTEEYGKAQYSDVNMIPCSSVESDDNLEDRPSLGNEALQNNIAADPDTPTTSSAIDADNRLQDGRHKESSDTDKAFSFRTINGGMDEIIRCLKAQLKDKETGKPENPKCLICMDGYREPLTSIQCWHVHCEECWMRTLGAKKLCPQCNMITSPADLRRIFL